MFYVIILSFYRSLVEGKLVYNRLISGLKLKFCIFFVFLSDGKTVNKSSSSSFSYRPEFL